MPVKELTYHPLDTVEATAAPERRNHLPEAMPVGTTCRCSRMIAPGHIYDGPPTLDRKARCHVVTRRFFCDHCQAVTSWFEQCDAGGHRIGVRLTAPLRITDAKNIAAFLAAHPHAAGVLS